MKRKNPFNRRSLQQNQDQEGPQPVGVSGEMKEQDTYNKKQIDKNVIKNISQQRPGATYDRIWTTTSSHDEDWEKG